MQYSQEHLKTMVYAEFGGQTECIMGNWKIENSGESVVQDLQYVLFSTVRVPKFNHIFNYNLQLQWNWTSFGLYMTLIPKFDHGVRTSGRETLGKDQGQEIHP